MTSIEYHRRSIDNDKVRCSYVEPYLDGETDDVDSRCYYLPNGVFPMFMDTSYDDDFKMGLLYKNDNVSIWKTPLGYGVEELFSQQEGDDNIFGHHLIWWFQGDTIIKDERSWRYWKYWTDKDGDWLRSYGISNYGEIEE